MTNKPEKKLYAGGISYSTDEEGLRAAFAQAGQVESALIIKDYNTQRSKGFGFVQMATPEEALAAQTLWNGKELDGRTLRVEIARENPVKNAGGGSFGGDRGDRGGERRRF